MGCQTSLHAARTVCDHVAGRRVRVALDSHSESTGKRIAARAARDVVGTERHDDGQPNSNAAQRSDVADYAAAGRPSAAADSA